MRLNKQLTEKIQESMASVLPITAIVFLLSVTAAPLDPGTLVLFLFGFFRSIPAFLAAALANRDRWKYSRHRLTVFRGFTARIRSASAALGMLSALFALALAFYGCSIGINQVTGKLVDMNLWDIQLLHPKGLWDFTSYEEAIARMIPLEASYTYAVYTDDETALTDLRQRASEEMGYSGNPMYREFLRDTYMKRKIGRASCRERV